MSRAPHIVMSLALSASLLVGCSRGTTDGPENPQTTGEESTSTGFPFDGSGGKEDAFGRSLVGIPRPYQPDPEMVADPLGQKVLLATNMRERRARAWDTARQVLEPVPLVGLASQIDRLPDCPAGVETRDIDRCENQSDEASCTGYTSGDASICQWNGEACAPSCDNLTLPDGAEIPKIPRWSTWYGVEDISTIFKAAYGQLSPEDQRARRHFTDEEIGRAMLVNNSAVDRSRRWPLRRYTDAVGDLFGCALPQEDGESDEDYATRCALSRQSNFSGGSTAGGGIARMVYSPAMVLHMMRNYPEILACRDDKLQDTWCGGDEPCLEPEENFSTCFSQEFPADAGNPWAALDPEQAGDVAGLPGVGGTVLIKATWARVGFGFKLPAYDTDADALSALLAPGAVGNWSEDGDRQYEGEDGDIAAFPTPNDIYTITTRSGGTYRLTGLHIMTKDLRHWNWITLWWSDEPDTDFGADRPENFSTLPGVWSNYKMCVVVDYTEADEDAAGRFADLPSLQAAITASGATPGAPSWCSNPYIEEGPANARTNCIGCHQHAGSRFDEQGAGLVLEDLITQDDPNLGPANRYPANGRTQRRTKFATDYSWAFSRMDDLTELMRTEIEYQGSRDDGWRRQQAILSLEGDAERGAALFAQTSETQACAGCHGEDGLGDFGPSFEQLFAQKTSWQMLNTVLYGRGPMPAWGETLTDQELADLFAFLGEEFDPAR